jgi:hypothetical protein
MLDVIPMLLCAIDLLCIVSVLKRRNKSIGPKYFNGILRLRLVAIAYTHILQ